MFVYQKIIDRSTLTDGFTITKKYHSLLKISCFNLQRGETRTVKIIIDGKEFEAQLINQKFDEVKYPTHPDIIQIRYSKNSPIAVKIREVFQSTYNYVESIKSLPENINRSKFKIEIPEEIQESIILESTELENVFIANCITCNEKTAITKEIKDIKEIDFELQEPLTKYDTKTNIKYGNTLNKIRILNRSIGDSLKQLYDYRCQMTGERIGERQDALCVEAHHIQPFSKSLNNDYSNIIILSPSYHRIIHRANPEFNRESLSFRFPNGLIEKVKLDKHLKL